MRFKRTRSTISNLTAWAQAEKFLIQQAAIIPLWNQIDAGFVSRRVGNYQTSPALGVPLLDQLWVK